MDHISELIIKTFAANPFKSFNHKQIMARIGANDKGTRQLIINAMRQLAEDGLLMEDDGKGRYKLNPAKITDDILPQSYITGTIDLKQSGKAYVIPADPNREDIQIAPNFTGHALHGDTVRVQLFPERKMHKPEGQVVEIVKRAKKHFVGVIQKQQRFAFMVSDRRTMPYDIFIPIEDLGGANDGDKVVVEFVDWPERLNNPVGRVVNLLGRPGDNNVEMQSILAEYDFPLEFPPEAEAEAANMHEPTNADLKNRRDFRNTFTFTIDPADAKDFDDALSLTLLPNGNYEVGVHIADVSHYVQPGSAIDREAYERGTSVYLVDRTFPMLPETLCNNLCSLRPNEDKLTFSVVVELDEHSTVVSKWFGKGMIRSNHRLAYEDAQTVIDQFMASQTASEGNNEQPEAAGTIKRDYSDNQLDNALVILHQLAQQLRNERYKKGAINFESQEVKFILDENAKPIGVYIKEQKEANWLIEEFMLLANRLVAEHIGGNAKGKGAGKTPAKTFVYRIHDEPNPEKLETFVQFVSKLGFTIKTGSRKALANSYNSLFKKIAGRGEENMIDSIAIRTMSKAIYSTENIGHYGLAFPYYTHFTSPIRRYPDLMVHRLLQHYLDGGASVSADEYEAYCQHCSQMEKKATDAERASVKYKQAEFLADKIGQVFPALISGVSKWGLYAEIEGNKCEGMIPIGSLKDDYYMLDEDNYQIVGRRHGKCYKLGYPVQIRVKQVDMLKKLIDFELVEDDADNTMPAHEADTKKAKHTKEGKKVKGKKEDKKGSHKRHGKGKKTSKQ